MLAIRPWAKQQITVRSAGAAPASIVHRHRSKPPRGSPHSSVPAPRHLLRWAPWDAHLDKLAEHEGMAR
jgi:hypothetical protein